MNKFILDLEVTNVELSKANHNRYKYVFLQIKMDGTNEQIITEPINNFKWPLRARRILQNIENLSGAFMYCSMYSDQNILIATSKVGLNSFPVSKPKKFAFPVLSCSNNAIVAAIVSMQATISAFFEIHRSTYRNYNSSFLLN